MTYVKHTPRGIAAYRPAGKGKVEVRPVEVSGPPVKYFGGKWSIAPWIIATFPPHECYVEPFAGGASVLLRKPLSTIEVMNDLNNEVVNFFEILRNRPVELVRAIELTPYARAEYELSFEPTAEPLERARRFYVRNRSSFGAGEGKSRTGFRFQTDNSTRGTRIVDEWARVDNLLEAALRLKQVIIERDDAFAIMKRYDRPKTLFYVDPPYVWNTRSSADSYASELNDSDHGRLADTLKGLTGMVVLSGYRSALYDELYTGWQRIEREVATNGKSKRVECLWLSPNTTRIDRLPLFAQAA